MKKLLFVSIVLLSAVACSKRRIVQASNPNLDPFPKQIQQHEKAQDPLLHEQWNMQKIDMTQVWNTTTTDAKRVTVAILGTGADYNHEDLNANMFVNRAEWREQTPGKQNPVDGVDNDGNGYIDDFVGYDFVENDGLAFDRNGAGTAMAGILGAESQNGRGLRGILNQVSLLPVRFIDESGNFFFPNLVNALNYALIQKADIILLHLPAYQFAKGQMQIFNIEDTQNLERAALLQVLNKISAVGIPIVTSAGNSGSLADETNSILEEFKRYNNILVMTSVDKEDKRPFIANYSKKLVHSSAPGAEVMTTLPGNKYGLVSGTSLAAAHAAGALALGIAKNYGRLNNAQMLESFIKPEASDILTGSQFETIGSNRLNIAKYLSYLGQL